MAVQDFMTPGIGPRRACKISKVDPANRVIEAILKDATTVQIAVFDSPGLFIWPKVDEYWTIHQREGFWMLDHRAESYDDEQKIADLNPGEGRIDADVVKTISGKDFVVVNNTDVADGSLLTYTKDGGWVAGTIDSAKTIDGTSGSALLSIDTSKYPIKQNSVLTYRDTSWIPTNDLQLESLVVKQDDTQYVKIESTGDITATNGNMLVINGSITAQNTATSPTESVVIDGVTGNLTSTGQVRGYTLVGDTSVVATTGNITASNGDVAASNNVTAGNYVWGKEDIWIGGANAAAGKIHLEGTDGSARFNGGIDVGNNSAVEDGRIQIRNAASIYSGTDTDPNTVAAINTEPVGGSLYLSGSDSSGGGGVWRQGITGTWVQLLDTADVGSGGSGLATQTYVNGQITAYKNSYQPDHQILNSTTWAGASRSWRRVDFHATNTAVYYEIIFPLPSTFQLDAYQFYTSADTFACPTNKTISEIYNVAFYRTGGGTGLSANVFATGTTLGLSFFNQENVNNLNFDGYVRIWMWDMA